MYVITGASGNTGKIIAHQLLNAGKPVTVIGRSADHLKEFADKGAEVAVGNLDDEAFLTQTFRGATAVYAMIPPNFVVDDFPTYQNRIADALSAAIRANGIPYVVSLSSFGAHLPDHSGVILGMHRLEQQLDAIEGVNALHLRAGFFYHNLFSSVGLLKNAGILAGFPIAGDKRLAFVHPADIAEVAARHLLALNFTGKNVQFVAGPRELTFDEVARVIGQAIGKPALTWTAFPYDQARAGMIQAGLQPSLADNYVEFCQCINNDSLMAGFERNADNTTPTTLDEFVTKEFLPAYQNA
ncbi:NmrA family NAD(P)-binding protein [Larkinella terrae]|uniref:NAD(P)H-binding protein n=1 Tax=Larkinella terrae TaxID=2025311 RepID=A0A7K0ETF7_9BACT|nr:NmrA family NAD(P)-binding protein [Larkinella terrae]MRS65105.1 NAD(P)H-binding protein [Larkinella terrae]